MALVYFDASALVKLVVDEDGSDVAARLWDGCDAALASRLAYVEVCAALAGSQRNGDLSESDLGTALAGFDVFWLPYGPLRSPRQYSSKPGGSLGSTRFVEPTRSTSRARRPSATRS